MTSIHWQGIVSGVALWGALSHAAQTFPTPTSPYAKWALGVLQYLLANYDKGRDALADPLDKRP